MIRRNQRPFWPKLAELDRKVEEPTAKGRVLWCLTIKQPKLIYLSHPLSPEIVDDSRELMIEIKKNGILPAIDRCLKMFPKILKAAEAQPVVVARCCKRDQLFSNGRVIDFLGF